MIVDALIDLLYGFIELITSGLNIPALPQEVLDTAALVTDYIAMGLAFLANYVNLDYLIVLWGIVLAVDAGILIYRFVMWILRKIPMLGIS